MTESTVETRNTRIPITASKNEFDQFFLPHLSMPLRGPKAKIEYWKIFCYILKVLYTGMQWKELSIDKGPDGKPEIHYTSVYRPNENIAAISRTKTSFYINSTGIKTTGSENPSLPPNILFLYPLNSGLGIYLNFHGFYGRL